MKSIFAAAILGALCAGPAFAKDVSVSGYTRRDGTYVAPYLRSAPDGDSSNNYGPSRSSGPTFGAYRTLGSYSSPQTRDSDRDGVPNYRDNDDDNDGVSDNSDRSQYGSERSTGYGSSYGN